MIFYLATKAILRQYQNGVLNILSHMVRPMNTHGEAGDYFHGMKKLMKKLLLTCLRKGGWTRERFDYIIISKMLIYFVSNLA